MSLAELRAELRALRKESVKPVSRMKKGDVSAELERLRKMREETPHAAAVPSAKSKAPESAKTYVKAAKETEFPHSQKPHLAQHHKHAEAHHAGKKAPAAPKKSAMSKAQLRAMLDEMTSDEE